MKNYFNPRIQEIEELEKHIVGLAKREIPSDVKLILIEQYKKGDNTLNVHVFCEYIEGAENLEKHDPRRTRNEIKSAYPFIEKRNGIQNSIKRGIEDYHSFDILTVDLYVSSSPRDSVLIKFGKLIDLYSKKDRIY